MAFLIPGYMESGDYFWWVEGKRLVRRAQVKKVTLDGCHYRLWQAEERDALASIIGARLRYAPSVRAREEFLGRMRELLCPRLRRGKERPHCHLPGSRYVRCRIAA